MNFDGAIIPESFITDDDNTSSRSRMRIPSYSYCVPRNLYDLDISVGLIKQL